MIGSLAFSEFLLCGYFLEEKNRRNKKMILPVIIPSLLLQILCVPYPVETFYWYTGAVNYTFIFALSLIQLVIFLKLKRGELNKKKTVFLLLTGCILSVFVGGDSYAASLSAVCVYMTGSLVMLICDRKALLRTSPLTLVTIAGLVICLVAPGNQVRLNTEIGGHHNRSVLCDHHVAQTLCAEYLFLDRFENFNYAYIDCTVFMVSTGKCYLRV